MASKNIALVTGANKGIGYEIVKALLGSDKAYHVYLGSRSLERGQEAVKTLQIECPKSASSVEAIQLDVTSDSSIKAAFETVKASTGHIDTLINNAGITKDLEFVRGQVSLRKNFIGAYDVNVAGSNVVTYMFLPLLLKSSDPRLIFVSGLGTFGQCAKGDIPLPPKLERGWPKKLEFDTVGYRCTKAALNMLMLDYHWKLQVDGVKVWSILPGFLLTDLGGDKEWVRAQGAAHPSAGGQFVKRVVEGERDADTGKLIANGSVYPF
ncbi:hypothetical protein B0H63DRAFT_534983 [Podospora didyma]|uniref:Uncharacterized protein n=1 Tax=Podospora didyma TaxID=330526 RepID=A0AAE0K274_9PEZI|nr:hypothetical protein B0H63DRAFT_534983 [Podospora didyma]